MIRIITLLYDKSLVLTWPIFPFILEAVGVEEALPVESLNFLLGLSSATLARLLGVSGCCNQGQSMHTSSNSTVCVDLP